MTKRLLTIKLDDKTLYPLDEYYVNNIPDGIQPANYRIGKYMNGIYTVIYVGRVDCRTDRGLKDRMLEHLKEYTSCCYFEWNSASSILDAYKTECKNYHQWYQNLENKIHPRKPDSVSYTLCPYCGK